MVKFYEIHYILPSHAQNSDKFEYKLLYSGGAACALQEEARLFVAPYQGSPPPSSKAFCILNFTFQSLHSISN